MEGSLKNSDQEEKIYYGGPANKFVKEQGTFTNLSTGEKMVLSTSQSQEIAANTRKNFSENEKSVSKDVSQLKDSIENYRQDKAAQNSPLSVPTYDPTLKPDFKEVGHFIPNYKFFSAHPHHGTNEIGTCTIVATQLLLLYHNYFSDRRIIDDSYLFQSEGYAVVNPNTCKDPMVLNPSTTGSEDSYYEYLIDVIDPTAKASNYIMDGGDIGQGYNGTSFSKAAKGITKILNDRKVNGKVQYNIGLTTMKLDSNFVLSTINKGQPLIISIYNYSGDPSNPKGSHAVVVYGYANYTYPEEIGGGTYQGYIAHMGWNPEDVDVWINSLWGRGYITLDIEHEHHYDNYVGGYYREEKCSECGHRRYAYETNVLSNTEVEITRTTGPCEEMIVIPSTILGREVVRLGDNAFDGMVLLENEEEDLLKTVILPTNLREIGMETFRYRIALESIAFPKTLKTIGEGAFTMCGMLASITIPASVEELGSRAFALCGVKHITFEKDSHLLVIRSSAFSFCKNLKHIRIPYSVWIIEASAFSECSSLETLIMDRVPTIDSTAFQGTKNVTFYTSVELAPAFISWSEGWNGLDRPIVWECKLQYDRVESFTKSDENPDNLSGILNPRRYGYTFDGWYTSADFSGERYATIASAPNGKLYTNWKYGTDSDSHISSGSSSCVAEGTMITLADGTQKAVETLTGDEQLLVWNLWTGAFEAAPILFIDSEARQIFDVINLTFSDGTTVKVIDEHGFWDVGLNEYVFLRADAAKYIGHTFKKETGEATLVAVEIKQEVTTAWSPVTLGHLCYYVNGMLSMPGATEGLINIFEVDPDAMKIDEEKFLADIATYGLFTYEEFSERFEVTEEIFNAVGGQYLKVAMGKGLLTEERIAELIERYAPLFPDESAFCE